MADQNNSQPVTIKDAILQVKKWASEKNYDQVKQGCEEILQVEPDNKELKDLLEEAKKALNPQPVVAAAPAASAAVTTTVTTTTVSAPVAPTPTPAPAPAPVAPSPVAAPVKAAPAPVAQPSPADIFKKPLESVKTAPAEPIKVEIVKKVSEKSGLTGKIIIIAVFAAILGGFIYAFTQGWINPFYDWILGLFGL